MEIYKNPMKLSLQLSKHRSKNDIPTCSLCKQRYRNCKRWYKIMKIHGVSWHSNGWICNNVNNTWQMRWFVTWTNRPTSRPIQNRWRHSWDKPLMSPNLICVDMKTYRRNPNSLTHYGSLNWKNFI